MDYGIIGIGDNIPYYAMLFPAWITFYYCGIKWKNQQFKKNNFFIITLMILIILVCNIIINILEYKFNFSYFYCTSQVKLTNTIYIFAIIYFISYMNYLYKDKYKNKYISTIGDYSFGIYFIHIFIIKILEKIFENLNIFSCVKSIIITIITILFSMIIIKTFNYITKNKLKIYLGF